MKNKLEEKLIKNAFEYGKKQIEENNFSLPEVEKDFKDLINSNNITEENNKELLDKLNKAFVDGQRFTIQDKLNKAVENLPKEIINKYGDSIKYDKNQDEFDNFYELDSKLEFIKNILKIEKIESKIKVLVFWLESPIFTDKQALNIEEFKNKCDKTLEKMRQVQNLELEHSVFNTACCKTKYMFIFDDGKGQVVTTKAIRYDIGSFNNFEDYIDQTFSNKEIPRLIKEYLELEKDKEQEDEEEAQ